MLKATKEAHHKGGRTKVTQHNVVREACFATISQVQYKGHVHINMPFVGRKVGTWMVQ